MHPDPLAHRAPHGVLAVSRAAVADPVAHGGKPIAVPIPTKAGPRCHRAVVPIQE
jgi:hypothetical protein